MFTHKLDVLIAVYIFCIFVAELMGGKTFPLLHIGDFTLAASVAIFVLPLIFTINDVITEVYGKERTRSIIRSGLVTVGLVLVFSLFATALPPSARFASLEPAYDQIFGLSARISAASLTAFIIAEFTDVAIFARLKKRLAGRGLWLRNNASNFVSQLLDTSIFMTLAFYDFSRPVDGNITFLVGLILPYWLLKCAASVIETPLVYWGVRWLKKGE